MAARQTNAANFFETELTAAMSGTATEASVLSTAGAPASPCYLVIDHDVPAKREIVYFDGTFTGTKFVTTSLANRYLEGSAGNDIVHDVGAKIICAPVAQMQRDLQDLIETAIPVGTILMWSGSVESIPAGFALCDGTSGTPDLRNRFVIGAGSTYPVGDRGGATTVTLTESQIPGHAHSGPSHAHASAAHNHSSGTLSAAGAGGHGHTIRQGDYSSYSNSPNTNGQNAIKEMGTSHSRLVGVGTSTLWSGSAQFNNAANAVADHQHSISGVTSTVTPGATGAAGTGATGSTGGGNSHENRPPYHALCYIMKVA